MNGMKLDVQFFFLKELKLLSFDDFLGFHSFLGQTVLINIDVCIVHSCTCSFIYMY